MIRPEDIRDAIFEGISQTELMGLALIQAGHLVWANQAMASMFGYQVDELLGQIALVDLFHPDDRARARELFERLESGQLELVQFDARGAHKHGKLVHCLAGGRLVILGEQRVPIVAITNVTERFAHVQQLRESAQRYRSIVEQSADGIALIDEAGVVVEWNRAQERLSGYSRAATLGHFIWEVQHRSLPAEQRSPQSLDKARKLYAGFLGNQVPDWLDRNQEQEIELPDGTHRRIQSRVFSVPTDKGFLIGSISRDLGDE